MSKSVCETSLAGVEFGCRRQVDGVTPRCVAEREVTMLDGAAPDSAPPHNKVVRWRLVTCLCHRVAVQSIVALLPLQTTNHMVDEITFLVLSPAGAAGLAISLSGAAEENYQVSAEALYFIVMVEEADGLHKKTCH